MIATRSKKEWTNDEDLILSRMYEAGTDMKVIAERLNRSEKAIVNRAVTIFLKRPKKQYSVYRGEKYLGTGTAEECAKWAGIPVSKVYWHVSPSAKKEQARVRNPYNGVRVDRVS